SATHLLSLLSLVITMRRWKPRGMCSGTLVTSVAIDPAPSPSLSCSHGAGPMPSTSIGLLSHSLFSIKHSHSRHTRARMYLHSGAALMTNDPYAPEYQVVVQLHNTFNLSVFTNEKGVDVFKTLIIPNTLVKS